MGSKTKHKTGHKSDIYSPLPEGASRGVQHPTGRGVGAMEASRDRVEQGAPGPMVEQGARAAMAGQGTREAMVGQPPRPRPQPPPQPLRMEPYKKNTWVNLRG